MAILSVGLVGAMRVFPVGLRASQRSELQSRAAILAQRVLESLKLQPCEALAGDEQVVDRFTVTTHISAPPLEALADIPQVKAAEVMVGWLQEARPRQLAYATYLWCEPGE